MKNTLAAILISISFATLNCSMHTRVLKQTDNSATIQFDTKYSMAMGKSKQDAMIGAEEKATEMFGKFKHEKPAECTQEFSAEADKDSASGATYWVCTIFVVKQ